MTLTIPENSCKANKCLQPSSKSIWVKCDVCGYWYHEICIGVNREDSPDDWEFYCYKCHPAKLEEYDSLKAKLLLKVRYLADAQKDFGGPTISRDMFKEKKNANQYNFSNEFPPTLADLCSRISGKFKTFGEFKYEAGQWVSRLKELLLDKYESDLQFIDWELKDYVEDLLKGEEEEEPFFNASNDELGITNDEGSNNLDFFANMAPCLDPKPKIATPSAKVATPPAPKVTKREKDEPDKDSKMNFFELDIVWAQMSSYPSWPAMVRCSPENIFQKENKIHVQFFGDLSRAWVNKNKIKVFHPSTFKAQNKFTSKKALNRSIEEAIEVYNLPRDERERYLIPMKHDKVDSKKSSFIKLINSQRKMNVQNDDLSEYEKIRLANIKERDQLFVRLGISEAKNSLTGNKLAASNRELKSEKKLKEEVPTPRRQSKRILGLSSKTDEEKIEAEPEPVEKYPRLRLENFSCHGEAQAVEGGGGGCEDGNCDPNIRVCPNL